MTTLETRELPISDADPFGPDLLENPLPFHHALREAGPVVRLTRYDVLAMGRYEHVHAALTNWQDFISSDGVGLLSFRREKPWRRPSLLLEADPPRHDAPRRVLAELLGPRTLRRLRDQWFADAADLVDEVMAGDRGVEIDALTQIAQRFPLRVFPDAVGIAREGREHLLPYGDVVFNAFGPPNDLVAAGAPRAAELQAWVADQCARDALSEDGFGAAIWAASDRGDITAEQAPLMVRSLLSAGVDTTVHGIAALLHAVATHPAQWARLRAEPALTRRAFDEAVRLESPVQTFFRTAIRDVELGGTVVPANQKILMFLGSANRDPQRWHRPDEFDLDRDPSGHVGFGMGIHQCVGQHIARLEAEAVLTALINRVASIELTGTPHRHHNNTLRAWDSLPVRITAA